LDGKVQRPGLGHDLVKLRADAEAYLGSPSAGSDHRPAYFNDAPSETPRRTPARSPAWKCCASSMSRPPPPAYSLDNKKNEVIAVYDLGGGLLFHPGCR
jgi:molecular chaperone DnaK